LCIVIFITKKSQAAANALGSVTNHVPIYHHKTPPITTPYASETHWKLSYSSPQKILALGTRPPTAAGPEPNITQHAHNVCSGATPEKKSSDVSLKTASPAHNHPPPPPPHRGPKLRRVPVPVVGGKLAQQDMCCGGEWQARRTRGRHLTGQPTLRPWGRPRP